MEFLYFAVLIFTLLLLAYNRVPLLIAIAIMVSLTVAWTELRHLFYVPSWFRFANGIIAVTLYTGCDGFLTTNNLAKSGME